MRASYLSLLSLSSLVLAVPINHDQRDLGHVVRDATSGSANAGALATAVQTVVNDITKTGNDLDTVLKDALATDNTDVASLVTTAKNDINSVQFAAQSAGLGSNSTLLTEMVNGAFGAQGAIHNMTGAITKPSDQLSTDIENALNDVQQLESAALAVLNVLDVSLPELGIAVSASG